MAKREILLSVLLALAVGGCNSARIAPSTPMGEEQIWLRTDGRSGRDNPALAVQFEADKAACTVAGGIDRACMTSRAYILVPRSQVDATAARLRSANGVN